MVLIQAETKILQFIQKNYKLCDKRETPGGIWALPKATLDSSFLYSLSDLLKESKHVRIKNSQNHFKSTFGSAYFISKNNEIKLAKPTKKEPRKPRFHWDIGLLFVHPIKMHWYCRILNLLNSKWNYLNNKLWSFTKLLVKVRYFRLDLLRLNFICKMKLRSRNWKGSC